MAARRTRIEQAQHEAVQAERVVAMIGQLRGLLGGRTTRAEVMAWARGLWPPGSGQGGPFSWEAADRVFTSLHSLDERRGDGALVREIELRAYLRWLSEGEPFHADDDAVINLECDIEDFAAQTGVELVRWWFDGIGWVQSGQFCAPGSGRAFLVQAVLHRPTRVGFSKRRGEDWTEAAIDLFEALGIDDADAVSIHPKVERARLPAWAVWRGDDGGERIEVGRYRSYAKACAQLRVFAQRGHRQRYWVESA